MNHRDIRHLLSFSLCLAAVFFGSTAYYAARAERYERYADYSSQRAAAQLMGSLESMRTVMEALPYTAATNLFPQTAAQLSRYAAAASAALSALNLQDVHLERTGTYINQAGDLAHVLLVQHLAGLPLEQDQLDQLETVCGGMDDLLEGVRDIKVRLNAGELVHGDFGAGDPELTAAMTELEEYAPADGLRYDGLYTHRDPVDAAHLNGESDVTEQQAAALAEKLAGRELPLIGELISPIPALCFADESTSVLVTKQGGQLLSLIRDEPEGQPTLQADEAQQAAREFLETWGYGALEITERYTEGDRYRMICTPTENGIALLPDAVTVTVSLVNGDILSLEAEDYLLYHRVREQTGDSISAAEAQSKLPDGLTADQGHMTLVRSPGGKELLCYAFLCETPEGDALRILVRADNGALWDLEPQPEQDLD